MSSFIKPKAPCYTGVLEKVQQTIAKSTADKPKLIKWLASYEDIEAQISEAEALEETLPVDISKLLKSGRMDDATVEQLAKKRALLDLLPARFDAIHEQVETLQKSGFETACEPVAAAVGKAVSEYYELQCGAAVTDLKQLGVDEDTAKRQAALRSDLALLNPFSINSLSGFGEINSNRARTLLWCFEALEAGLHPHSSEAKKFKKEWLPEK